MATEEIYKWQIYCITEEKNVYEWGATTPTSCPNDTPGETAHTINTETIAIVETLKNSDVTITGVDIDGVDHIRAQPNGFRDLTGYNVYRKGYRFQAAGGETTVQEACYDVTMKLQGLVFKIDSNANPHYRDYIEVKMCDSDGTYYPAGTVLATFASTVYVYPNMEFSCICDDAKDIPPGIYVQFIYNSFNPNTENSSSSSSSSLIEVPNIEIALQHCLRTTPA